MIVPFIDNGKMPEEHLNVAHMLALPPDTPFGNLALKWMDIVQRIDRTNLEIRRVYASYIHPKIAALHPGIDIRVHQYYQETVLYWMRKTADEIIMLCYVLNAFKAEGTWPTSIEIDSIGRLLHPKAKKLASFKKQLSEHEQMLQVLNDVSNAYKHSFINTDLLLVGAEYPVVYALSLDRNNLSNKPKLHQVNFAELIQSFSAFFLDIKLAFKGI